MNPPLLAHVTRRRKALDALVASFNKMRVKWEAERAAVDAKYEEKLKGMKAQIEAESKDLQELEARLKP